MKKLLCVLMFGLMFGQTELSTRLYTIELDMSGGGTIPIDMLNITGHDLSSAIINVVSVENNTADNINLSYACDVVEENGLISAQLSVMTPPRTSIYMANQNCYIKNPSANPIYSSYLSFQITAEFPEEDTGYIEEGFDYCIDVGANLVASPCRFDINIIDTLPSQIQNNLTSIIGQGVAATNDDGNWIGSLNGLGGGDGYWFISNASACFNYNCAEN